MVTPLQCHARTYSNVNETVKHYITTETVVPSQFQAVVNYQGHFKYVIKTQVGSIQIKTDFLCDSLGVTRTGNFKLTCVGARKSNLQHKLCRAALFSLHHKQSQSSVSKCQQRKLEFTEKTHGHIVYPRNVGGIPRVLPDTLAPEVSMETGL